LEFTFKARLADDMQQQSQSDGFAIETVQHVKNSAEVGHTATWKRLPSFPAT